MLNVVDVGCFGCSNSSGEKTNEDSGREDTRV